MIKPVKIEEVAQKVSSKKMLNENVTFGDTKSVKFKTVVKDELIKQSKALKWFDYFNTKKGEALNIIINAIGTGLVAPFFIAYNPLSKEDDKTTKYSALRQPVSAILAIITQIGINMQFDKILDKYARMGKDRGLGEQFDLSLELENNKDSAINKVKNELIAKGNTPEIAFKNAMKQIDNQLSSAKKNLGALKVITGMILSLIIMPVTCSALNWLYPRLVDIFFPSLCKEDKKMGGKNDISNK